ncbi:TPA: restriction endonuclease subunit S [Streptococcus equi subsp. zooepidemicus]|nr:restriction endonuclease subunit S [Streptococcus equi subsp. zooepidemicus]
MVNSVAKKLEKEFIEIIDLPKDDISWSSVSLSEVINKGKRFEASVFDLECKHARNVVENSIYGSSEINIDRDLIECYTRSRFKRIWLEKSEYPIYQPTSMLDVYPKNDGYISKLTNTNIEALKVSLGQILITCSGTVGNISFVSETLNGKIFSHDLLRVKFKKEYDNGFFYAFLKTYVGKQILKSNKYGSVISHIEAEHMNEVRVPLAPLNLKKKIHGLIIQSYDKRDESNRLIDEATKIMIEELELPPINDLKKEAFSYSREINSFSTKLSDLDGRLEGSYHIPLIEVIERYISKKAIVKNLNSEDITEKIILPGRFKRVYVEKGNGKVFLGGKEINQLDPENKKYLSLAHHSDRIKKELNIIKDMVLVTCSGTIGKVALVPKHWNNWTLNQHVMRIVSKEQYYALIFTWLNSEYGKELIRRQTYGSVVNEITDKQLGAICIPIFKEDTINNSIISLINEANELRYQAYKLEQKAIEIMNREVLGL